MSYLGFRNNFADNTFFGSLDLRSDRLIAVQIESFRPFLHDIENNKSSVEKILNSFFPVVGAFGGASIEFVSYRCVDPQFNVEQCKKRSITYSSDIYITARLVVMNSGEEDGIAEIISIKEQEILLCSIPLMTSSATFIINGFERVVVSQMHRSPGVFFIKEINDGFLTYVANIIPYRGAWLVFGFDARGSLYFRIDKKKKLPVCVLLLSIGMKNEEIIQYFHSMLNAIYVKDLNLWKLDLDCGLTLGISSPADLINEDGVVVIKKSTTINKKNIDLLKSLNGNIYCSSHDMIGMVVAADWSTSDSKYLIKAGKPLSSSDLDIITLENSKVSIVNCFVLNYSHSIINSISSISELTERDAMLLVFKNLYSNEPFVFEEAKERLYNLLFSQDYYDLHAVGRYKINKRLGLETDERANALQLNDILATIIELIRLKESASEADDIDHLGNRRIRSVGEMMENHFRLGMVRVVRGIKEKLSSASLTTALPSEIVNGGHITKSIKDFFMTSQLSQFMDQTNPLSELAHKRRISALGMGGLNRDRASVEVRDVHPSHYGRICPIETPEGQNIGLISSLATYSSINKYGFIETPYRIVESGKITSKVVLLDADSESRSYICQFVGRGMDSDNFSSDSLVSARFDGDFFMIDPKKVQYVDVSPRQMISIVTALIPFLENDDAKRALMGSNMQRQAVPLIVPDAPLIATGMESVVAADAGVVIRAKRSGIVKMVDANNIIIFASNNQQSTKNLKDINSFDLIDSYSLVKFQRSNSSTCINYNPTVRIGDFVKSEDVIADGPATSGGEIALGKNLNVAFMSWYGYNFEDAIVISDSVVRDDEFTSIKIESFEVAIRDTRLGIEEVTRDVPNLPPESLRNLDEFGIIKIGAKVFSGDVLVGKITPKAEVPATPEERLLRAIFGEKISDVKDSSLRVPSGISGVVVDVSILTKRGNEKSLRAKQIEEDEIRKLKEIYDKEISVIDSLFYDKIKSFCESSCDKEIPLQHLMNSTSIIEIIKLILSESRLIEYNLAEGLDSIRLQYESIINAIQTRHRRQIEMTIDGDELQAGILQIIRIFVAIKNKLQTGDKMAGRHGNKGVVSKIVASEDMPFMMDGTPVDIVLNPLGVPSRMNIGQILETHLGLASKIIGKNIDKMIRDKSDGEKIRCFLLSILTDKSLKDKIEKMSNHEILLLSQKYRNGMPFATPVFEGANVVDIDTLFDKLGTNKSGQVMLRDGKTGDYFDRPVTVGCIYMMKLHHLVDNKMHARSTGPYSLVTQQPLGGRAHFGGQRFGEMECWALESYGAAYVLQEMLTVKSDDVEGRNRVYESIVKGESSFSCGTPESFNVLFKELRSLCFNVSLGSFVES